MTRCQELAKKKPLSQNVVGLLGRGPAAGAAWVQGASRKLPVPEWRSFLEEPFA